MLNEPNSYYPIRERFSRQQVHERTGISDDVLAFWIKQGILLPLPAEPRAHRRFSFEQLHVAAVINSMRSLGANIGVLRKFSDALQEGFRLIHESQFDGHALFAAAGLVDSLDRFHSGQRVKIFDLARGPEEEEIAESPDDVVRSWMASDRQDGACAEVAAFSRSLSPAQGRSLYWARLLIDPSHLTHSSADSLRWVAWLDEEYTPRIENANAWLLESGEGPDAAFYIPVSKLVACLWPERLERARELYEDERLRSRQERERRKEEVQ